MRRIKLQHLRALQAQKSTQAALESAARAQVVKEEAASATEAATAAAAALEAARRLVEAKIRDRAEQYRLAMAARSSLAQRVNAEKIADVAVEQVIQQNNGQLDTKTIEAVAAAVATTVADPRRSSRPRKKVATAAAK